MRPLNEVFAVSAILAGGLAGAARELPGGVFARGPWRVEVSPRGGWSASVGGARLMAPAEGPLWEFRAAERVGDSGTALREAGQLHIDGADRPQAKDASPEPVSVAPTVGFASAGWRGETLALSFTSAVWRVEERLAFSDAPLRIRRALRLVNVSGVTRAFRDVTLRVPMKAEGLYCLPAMFWGYQNEMPDADLPTWRRASGAHPSRGKVQSVPVGRVLRSHYRVKGLLSERSGGKTILFFLNPTTDNGTPQFVRLAKDVFAYESAMSSQGWAEPDVPQTVGDDVYQVVDADQETALTRDFPQLLDDLGIRPPCDRPDWVPDAAIYGFDSLGVRGGSCVGGLKASESVARRAAALGFNAVWCLPVQFGTVGYAPTDYFRIDPRRGTESEYREMVAGFRRRGLRFLQDIVPHGGTSRAWPHRAVSVDAAVFTPEGNVLDFWGMDFADPAWQRYMASVADHYRSLGVDGFRIDAPYGSLKPNWRHPSMTNLPHVVSRFDTGSDRGAYDSADWAKALAKGGGRLSPLPYPRASMAQCWGGCRMVEAIRAAARKGKPDGAVAAEVFGLPFHRCADMLFDMTYPYLAFRLLDLGSEDFVAGLSQWMAERQCVTPADAVLLRYTACHDQLYMNGYTGAAAWRALLASAYLVRGVPLVFDPDETGHGTFVRRLNALRAERAELRRGAADYLGVRPADRRVFAVRRSTDSSFGIGLVNFSPARVTTALKGAPQLGAVTLAPWEFVYIDVQDGREFRPFRQEPLTRVSEAAVTTRRLAGAAPQVIDLTRFTRWRVRTLDGGLDDFVDLEAVRQRRYGSRKTTLAWRTWAGSTLWDSESQPLDPTNAALEFADGKGRSLFVRAEDFPAATFSLLVKDGEEPGLKLVVTPDDPKAGVLLTQSAVPIAKAPVRAVASSQGGLSVRGESLGYRIEGPHYSILLRRLGGGIRSWRDARGTELVTGSDVVARRADGGICGVAGWDLDTEARFRRIGDRLVVTFCSYLCETRRKTRREIESALEYTFDATSAQVGVRTLVRPLEAAEGHSVDWLMSLTETGERRVRLPGARKTGARECGLDLLCGARRVLPWQDFTRSFVLSDGPARPEGAQPGRGTFDPRPFGTDLSLAARTGFTDAQGRRHFAPPPGLAGGVRWAAEHFGSFVADPGAEAGVAYRIDQPDPVFTQFLAPRAQPGHRTLAVRLRGEGVAPVRAVRSIDYLRYGDGKNAVPTVAIRVEGTRSDGSRWSATRTFSPTGTFPYRDFRLDFSVPEVLHGLKLNLSVQAEVESKVYLGGLRLEEQ